MMEMSMAKAMKTFSTHVVFLSTANSHKEGGMLDKNGSILDGILHILRFVHCGYLRKAYIRSMAAVTVVDIIS